MSIPACDSGLPFSSAPQLPNTPFDYTVDLPAHFIEPGIPGSTTQIAVIDHDNTPADNPISDHGATLGRVLFYDRNLSQDLSSSCATCHRQLHGFSDPAIRSIGFSGKETKRHSMGLTNARFYKRGRAFWDEQARSLEEQVLIPVQDAFELGTDLKVIEQRLATLEYYPALFENAFGDDQINSDRISKALAQFVRSLVSFESKYDEGRAAVDRFTAAFPNFTDEENRGKELFLKSNTEGGLACVSCHATEAFVGVHTGPKNNGLDVVTLLDPGIGGIIGADSLDGMFKPPSLRNVGVRSPYMHDGRFATLREVVDHYSDGVEAHQNLSDELKDESGQPLRFTLSETDKQALVAFLHSLTDNKMLNDPKFSDPFRR
ncbi:MAG: cytochrome-c peroxidase [Rhodothermales bacterium]|nr:cytochrome-c peroxidase [Rhodothermales bacterium]